MVKKQKTKAMAAKPQRNRKEISLSNKKEENYKNNTENKLDLDQANNKYLLQL